MDGVVLSLTQQRFDAPDLVDRVIEVFGTEIEAEIERRAPVDSGYLKEHWTLEWPIVQHRLLLGTNAFYAPWLTTGTGIYGPRNRMICARGARQTSRYDAPDPSLPRFLSFYWKKKGTHMVIRCVRGIRPNPYVEDGLVAGCDNAVRALSEMSRRGML